MIDQLDKVLRALLVKDVPLANDDQVRFDPPDDVWRGYVDGTLQDLALNVYLVEARENRKLRAREQAPVGGRVTTRAATWYVWVRSTLPTWATGSRVTLGARWPCSSATDAGLSRPARWPGRAAAREMQRWATSIATAGATWPSSTRTAAQANGWVRPYSGRRPVVRGWLACMPFIE